VAIKTVNVKLGDGKIYRFAVANSLSQLHHDLFISATVVAELDRAIRIYTDGEWTWKDTGRNDDGSVKREFVQSVPAKLLTLKAQQVTADLRGYQHELFVEFRRMVDDSLKLAEVESPTRQRVIDDVLTRADMPTIFAAVFNGQSNVVEPEPDHVDPTAKFDAK
jgi:hypothetical protein